jgi:hypothetical protein
MIFFQGTASGHYFNGDITCRDCTNVIKTYKDGRIEFKARYSLVGKDFNNSNTNIFIEDNLLGYDENKQPITKPTIITNSNNLSFLQTADIRGIIEEINGNKIIRYMWNENNKNDVPYPVAYIPDETKDYSKEVFVFNIEVGGEGYYDVLGANEIQAVSIGFTCTSNTSQFQGKGLDNFVDTRFQFPGQPQTLSARYILDGVDNEGNPSRVYVENIGVDFFDRVSTEPIIITDNPKWAWMEKAPLHGNTNWTNGLHIELWTINDPSLWENQQPEPQPEPQQEPKQEPKPDDQCSSKIIAQGYKCCSSICKQPYVDENGEWGVEDGKWCGCIENKNSCPSTITNKGYSCCSTCSKVRYVDEDGKWGVENHQWCGIPTMCKE